MIVDPILQKRAEELAARLSDPIPFDVIEAKYKLGTDKERAQHDEIKKMSSAYLKAGDIKGLKNYLKHIKAAL